MERQEGIREGEKSSHVVVLPFPIQGHINPMLQFSKRLASKGLKVTLLTTSKSMQPCASSSNINFHSLNLDEGENTKDLDEYLKLYEDVISKRLAEFMEEQLWSQNPPKVVVYDSGMPWAMGVAKKFGVLGASFFTQCWAVNAIFYHLKRGAFRVPLEEPVVSLPSMPALGLSDLPTFASDNSGAYPGLCKLVRSQFENLEEANWVFCNTYDMLEQEIIVKETTEPGQ
ncbi:UDP-glucuronosyl/UDP-glucosyltransferase, partial [Corchorus capsularis]